MQPRGTRGMRRVRRAFTLLAMQVALCGPVLAQSNTRQIVAPPPSSPAQETTRSITGQGSPATVAAQPAAWAAIPGSATAVGTNARGDLWIIGNTPPGRDHSIYRWTAKGWQQMSGTGMRIAVDPAGYAWVVESSGAILHYTGAAWERIAGDAIDIAVGGNGAVWTIGRDGSISRGVATTTSAPKATVPSRGRPAPAPTPAQQYRWEKIQGTGVHIAVDPQGNPWVVGAAGEIYHYTGSTRTQFPGLAKDIAVGADGVVYVVGTTPSPGGFTIWRSQGTTWVNDGIAGEVIAAGPAGLVHVGRDAGSGNALTERVPNSATAGSPPIVPTPASPATVASGQPKPPVAAAPSEQSPPTSGEGAGGPHVAGVRPIGGAAPTPAPTTGQKPSGQVPSDSQTGTAPASEAAPLAPRPSPPAQVVIPTQLATIQVPQSTGSQSSPKPPAGAVEAPPGTITLNQPGPITLNQPPVTAGVPGAPPGSGSSVTGGTLVTGAPPGASPPANKPLTVTGLGYTPIQPPQGAITLISGDQYVYVPGKLLCSDPEVMGICGNVDAGYVGAYTLNTSCSSGFYDMINGGTCWNCPNATDGHGAWIRSADSVDSQTACWRNATSPAHWDKYGLAWDCSSGQFWDSQDQNHNINGSCWDCPSGFGTRSADPVWSNTACYGNQTSPAIFVKYNGCPAPNQTQMYPNDQRRPGEPFLDIASGLSVAGNAGGACWACPVSDQQGNYLYTTRNANTLIGRKTGNNGCMVQFQYAHGKFTEPGLSGLAGVTDVLNYEQVFQRSRALTTFLYGLAAAQKLSGTQAYQWVASQWADIAAHPYQNAQIRALMFQYVTAQAPSYMYLSGASNTGSAAEQKAQAQLVSSFQEYIRARRTYVAQEALDMYYAWNKNVGVTRSLHAESELQIMFYYGTVPLDFSSIAAAVLVPTATGVGVLGSIMGAEAFASAINAVRTVGSFTTAVRPLTLFSAFDSLEAFQLLPALAQFSIVAGPVSIAFAGATMAAMAISQVVQIATAEQNLKTAKSNAMQSVSLSALLQQTNGQDQAAMYWSLAVGGVTSEAGNQQIAAAAQAAYTTEKQSNFAEQSPVPKAPVSRK